MAASRLQRVRCRLALHRWTAVGAGDGQRMRRCRLCGREDGPFPWYEGATTRLDARDVPPGGLGS
ncbi:hypothetical protein ACI8AF_26155 [Blastococcus sp. SYSU D00669]